jgi:excisionase family DNA binding protein
MLAELNSTEEIAEHCRVSPWTVSAWMSQGKLKRTKVGGRTLIAKVDLLEFIRKSTEVAPRAGRRPGKRTPAQKSA